MKTIIILLFTIIFSFPSHAQVYKWVDEKGVIHFSDDPGKIPEKYRQKMDAIGFEEEKIDRRAVRELPPQDKREEPYRDRLGRGEEYWKNRVEEWRTRLRAAQEKAEELRLKYNELTEKINDAKSTIARNQIRQERDRVKQEMNRYKGLIEEAKMMLEKKIPEEAEFYKAKQEWIK